MTETLIPVRRYERGVVVAGTLARRSGPGTSYPEYPDAFHRGDGVVAMDVCTENGNVWVLVGPEVWSSSVYEGRVLIAGGFVAIRECE